MGKIITVISLLALGCCFLFCACDSRVRELRAYSIIDDDCLILPFKPEKATLGGYHIRYDIARNGR
ncbi:MAG: hypothetical protein ACOCRK_09245 [bacterium]